MSKLLTYEPQIRAKPLRILNYSFFDELRDKATTLPNGKPLPNLFNFTSEEIKSDPEIVEKLIPRWYK